MYEAWCDEHGLDYQDDTGEQWDRFCIYAADLLADRGA